MKIGLLSAPPLTLATLRFLIAGLLLLIFIYWFKKGKYPLPNKREWKILFLLGLLNTSLFVGLGNLALRTISAGIFNLFLPINPFLFALFSLFFMGTHIRLKEWLGMAVSALGLFIATYPSLADSHATLSGILFLTLAMVSMAVGSLVYKKANLHLPNIVINAWQVFIGGALLIIPTLFLESGTPVRLDAHLVAYLLWSVFGLSIFSMGLWFYMLKQDAVRANNWLLLNPVTGYMLAAIHNLVCRYSYHCCTSGIVSVGKFSHKPYKRKGHGTSELTRIIDGRTTCVFTLPLELGAGLLHLNLT
jgi:drug/metabolite transporter (DMT)-like permease